MGNNYLIIVMVVIIGFFFFWTWRNNRKRQRDEAEKTSKLVAGAEVMTNFGLFGTVQSLDLENNKVVLEVSPGTFMTVHRQTIARIDGPAAESDADAPVDAANPSTSASSIDEANAAAKAAADAAGGAPKATNTDQPEFGERITPTSKNDD
ncbi:MAG TPA: preprotein translocase subunit YajC [Gryllotalpicola sp.]